VRSLQSTAAFKAALLAGGAGIIALAQPAYAQDGAPVQTNEPVTTAPTADQTPGNSVTEKASSGCASPRPSALMKASLRVQAS